MPITALPTPPSRQDPTNFNDRADAFLGALPQFQSEANALQVNVNTSEVNAVNAAAAVLSATNIVKWVSGTTYANGAVVWSPINGLAYRRITTSGSGTTDPSADTTNYKQVNGTGDVSTTGDQTIGGIKTFTSTIVGNVSGNAGTVTNGVYTTGNQTIDGTKTFSNTVVGNISGNAATVSAVSTVQVLNATSGASVGAIGSYALMSCNEGVALSPGAVKAGSSLEYRATQAGGGRFGSGNYVSTAGVSGASGTWRLMGNINGEYEYGGVNINHGNTVSLWLRIT